MSRKEVKSEQNKPHSVKAQEEIQTLSEEQKTRAIKAGQQEQHQRARRKPESEGNFCNHNANSC